MACHEVGFPLELPSREKGVATFWDRRRLGAFMVSTVQVGLIGMGVVGTGVARLLIEESDRLARRSGRAIRLKRVVVNDLQKPRSITLPAGTLTDDPRQIWEDGEIAIVVQLVGGVDTAREYILAALQHGKDVVTANKAVLAEHGDEIFRAAAKLGRSIAFDAAVAGGIPIVSNVAQTLTANQITALRGILNGTSNFIISKMEDEGTDYHDAVREAQRRGYAEADPSMDVDGTDAAQKLSILAQLAFDTRVAWRDIPRQGIERLEPTDLRFAAELGYRIKLLAMARSANRRLEMFVSPTLVPIGTPMAAVHGAYNAIRVDGDMVGRIFFHGLGAGEAPTASAVVADLIDTAVGRTALTFQTTGRWSDGVTGPLVADSASFPSRFYWRLSVEDHPGVLARVANILADEEISISSVIQRETLAEPVRGHVDLIIMTHETTEGAARKVAQKLATLPDVDSERGVRYPVADESAPTSR